MCGQGLKAQVHCPVLPTHVTLCTKFKLKGGPGVETRVFKCLNTTLIVDGYDDFPNNVH